MKNETRTIDVTPDFGRMFDLMMHEAKNQGQPKSIFADLAQPQELEALRAFQRFIAPLAVAANAMTNTHNVERMRDLLTDLSRDTAKYADELEADLARDAEDPTDGKGLL